MVTVLRYNWINSLHGILDTPRLSKVAKSHRFLYEKEKTQNFSTLLVEFVSATVAQWYKVTQNLSATLYCVACIVVWMVPTWGKGKTRLIGPENRKYFLQELQVRFHPSTSQRVFFFSKNCIFNEVTRTNNLMGLNYEPVQSPSVRLDIHTEWFSKSHAKNLSHCFNRYIHTCRRVDRGA